MVIKKFRRIRITLNFECPCDSLLIFALCVRFERFFEIGDGVSPAFPYLQPLESCKSQEHENMRSRYCFILEILICMLGFK